MRKSAEAAIKQQAYLEHLTRHVSRREPLLQRRTEEYKDQKEARIEQEKPIPAGPRANAACNSDYPYPVDEKIFVIVCRIPMLDQGKSASDGHYGPKRRAPQQRRMQHHAEQCQLRDNLERRVIKAEDRHQEQREGGDSIEQREVLKTTD